MSADLERAARALLDEEARMFTPGTKHLFWREFDAIRSALAAEQRGECADCDAGHPRYFVPENGETIHTLPGGAVNFCAKAHPTPPPPAMVDAENRALMGAMRAALSQIDASPWFHESAPNVIRERVAALLAASSHA